MRVAIIGGGISGLTVAWKLKKLLNHKVSISIYEKQPHFGGWIQSPTHFGEICEAGPRGFRGSGKGLKTLNLLRELNIVDELEAPSEIARARYLGINNQLKKLPSNPLQLFFSSLGRTILKGALRERKIPSLNCDESVAHFFERRFGSEILESLVDPLISGIFAGDPRKLSISACFPDMKHQENEYGSVVKAFLKNRNKKEGAGFFSFKKGMAILTNTLSQKLLYEDVELFSNHQVTTLLKHVNGWEVKTPFHSKPYDCVIIATPAHKLPHLIPDSVTQSFLTLPYASVATVHVIYKDPQKIPSGFGFLIPSSEKSSSLGVIFDSSLKESPGRVDPEKPAPNTHLSILLGGIRHPLLTNEPHERLTCFALKTVEKYLHITIKPDFTHVQIAHQAIAQYPLDYHKKVNDLENHLEKNYPGIYVTGSSYYGVGINDCVDHAEKLALKIAATANHQTFHH